MHGDSPKLNHSLGKALELLDVLAAKRRPMTLAEHTRVPEQDVRVTLTATMAVPYSRNSSDTYPMTRELTVLVPCAATRLQMDCDALTITNPQDVRENLPLVRQGKYGAVLWAVENSVTSGTGKGKFSPDATCTRGQVVTFLYRASGE